MRGTPKGLERVHGVRIIDRVRAALEPVVDDLLLIANDDAAGTWLPGVRWERDVLRDVGSVAGIHAALVHAASPVLVVAWDMPFVPTALLAALRDTGRDADAAVPESDSRRGLEPLCAYYTPACVSAIERRIAAGDRRVIAFYDDVSVARLDRRPRRAVRRSCPALHERQHARGARSSRRLMTRPPMVAVIGKKHSGKTTLTVRLCAELHRRGHRVMTIKHGSHTFNIDPATTDTYRHYHEGNAERVAMAAPDKFALIVRWSDELGPEEIAARHMSDADIVVCEGFKRSQPSEDRGLPRGRASARRSTIRPTIRRVTILPSSRTPTFRPRRCPSYDSRIATWLDTLADLVEERIMNDRDR